MKELDDSIGTLLSNKDIATKPIEILPKEICSEIFLGRCNKPYTLEIGLCSTCQKCEIPHEIVYINPVKEKK
jgi:hypothetical protein